jgi:hypothetical protein
MPVSSANNRSCRLAVESLIDEKLEEKEKIAI